MQAEADILPQGGMPRAAREPSLAAIVVLFWAAFAIALVALRVLDPGYFQHDDPDSFLRLVRVRDLLAGQGWFDLVQHRMDPPAGSLLQWSRVIDAPLAVLILAGRALGLGETPALTLWPILLLLPLMGASAAIAATLGGRAAGVLALGMVLLFFDPLLVFFPGNIDHHNAQMAVTLAMLAFAMRMPVAPAYGLLAGACASLSLAIGLEMLPHVTVLAAIVALRFAWTGTAARATAMFGATLGLLPAALYLLTGSPLAATACDALSWAFAVPILIAGLGLAVLARFAAAWPRGIRVALLLTAAAAAAAWFAGMTPQCLHGPYGQLPPEVRSEFLNTALEARPVWVYARIDPVTAIGSLGPLVVALAIALLRIRRDARWLLPTALLALALLLSLYQLRTLPFAGSIAAPIVAVWIAGVTAHAQARDGLMRAVPALLAVLIAVPFTWLGIGWLAVKAAAATSHGALAPTAYVRPDAAAIAALSPAERECFDARSAAVLAATPPGLVLAPLLYGPTVLMLSQDDTVVAGPYHRSGQAILDTINAMRRAPPDAKAIFEARKVDYVAACTTADEVALAVANAPDGLLAALVDGHPPDWLEPLPATPGSGLRLWRVRS